MPRTTADSKVHKGAWTAVEDKKLAEVVEFHGPKQWETVAAKAGLNLSAKSCRLRWMNYLRPHINRGNFSDQEEDLILRLHKLLGNRWSLIAARLPGRTDNEIKNYWNSHLSNKKLGEEMKSPIAVEISRSRSKNDELSREVNSSPSTSGGGGGGVIGSNSGFDVDDFFDFSNENPSTLEWVTKFIEYDRTSF